MGCFPVLRVHTFLNSVTGFSPFSYFIMEIPEGKYLGRLCRRGHDWNGTGQSLRYKNGGKCTRCIIKNTRKYQQENKEKYSEQRRKYRQENKEKISEKNRKYRQENKDEIRKHRQENKVEINNYMRIYNQTENRKINNKMSVGIREALKGNKAGRHWESLVNYNLKQLIRHLKKNIPEGYTWIDFLNGDLHIDHIIPISLFTFNSPDDLQFKICWSLNNLQLLPAKENLQKHDKLIKDFQTILKV